MVEKNNTEYNFTESQLKRLLKTFEVPIGVSLPQKGVSRRKSDIWNYRDLMFRFWVDSGYIGHKSFSTWLKNNTEYTYSYNDCRYLIREFESEIGEFSRRDTTKKSVVWDYENELYDLWISYNKPSRIQFSREIKSNGFDFSPDKLRRILSHFKEKAA